MSKKGGLEGRCYLFFYRLFKRRQPAAFAVSARIIPLTVNAQKHEKM